MLNSTKFLRRVFVWALNDFSAKDFIGDNFIYFSVAINFNFIGINMYKNSANCVIKLLNLKLLLII